MTAPKRFAIAFDWPVDQPVHSTQTDQQIKHSEWTKNKNHIYIVEIGMEFQTA